MIHYTCDRCKRAINPDMESRYVVEIDVRVAGTYETMCDHSDDLDQLAELHDQLQRELKTDVDVCLESDCQQAGYGCDGGCDDSPDQYDLCQQCYEIFVSNPLGRESTVDFGFSNN